MGPISLMLLRAPKPILLFKMLVNNDLVYPKTVNTKAHMRDSVTGNGNCVHGNMVLDICVLKNN